MSRRSHHPKVTFNTAHRQNASFDASALIADDPLAPARPLEPKVDDRPRQVRLYEQIQAERERTGRSVVYYLRRRDGLIKIGFTSNLALRAGMLTQTYGDLDLLATEPGSRNIERQRHRQFRTARLDPLSPWEGEGATEWFAAVPSLMHHIEMLRGT